VPSVDKLTINDKKAVLAARAAYDLLSEAEKAQVENYRRLVEAEKRIAALQ